MKKIIRILVATFLNVLICFPGGYVYGADYSYEVSGSGDAGYVHGEIESNRGSKDVEGYLYLDSGDQVHFEGEWVGHGEIEGHDEEGNFYNLETE